MSIDSIVIQCKKKNNYIYVLDARSILILDFMNSQLFPSSKYHPIII